MSISFDLSHIDELRPLAEIVEIVNDAAQGISDRRVIVGATARDLVLHYAYQLPITRKTTDLDIAIGISSWSAYDQLQENLIARGARRHEHVAHGLTLRGWNIDIVPFGGVEHDGAITWPPAKETMSVLGFDEASRHAIKVVLPKRVEAAVASLPALLLLKVIAWDERHRRVPRRDGEDIRTIISSYAEPWNENRLYGEADDLLQRFHYDNELAGAALLGRDAGWIAQPATAERVGAILEREAAGETLLLAGDMRGRVEETLRLLEAVYLGFTLAARRIF